MSVSDFYKMELEKLNLEFDKIKLFTKHPPTLGNYREQVLKAYLRQFVPSCLSINSGFVFNNENSISDDIYTSQTKQIDCMIYDDNNFVPYLRTNDFVIIEPEALENIKSIWDNVNYKNKQVFKAVFAYKMTFDSNLLYMALDNNEIQQQLRIKHLNELPLYICVPNEYLIYFSRTTMECDENLGFDPYESEMTVIKPTKTDYSFVLQLFSVALKNNIEFRYKNKLPDIKGLFSCSGGRIEYWSHHFRLNCE